VEGTGEILGNYLILPIAGRSKNKIWNEIENGTDHKMEQIRVLDLSDKS
jgi:hypothetical protein